MNFPHPNWDTVWKVAAILAVFFFAQWLDTGPSDMESEQRSADSLRDAVAQAKEQPWAISQK